MVLLENLCDDVVGEMVGVCEEWPPRGSFQIFMSRRSLRLRFSNAIFPFSLAAVFIALHQLGGMGGESCIGTWWLGYLGSALGGK